MAKPAVVVVVLLLAAACSSSPGADAPPPARPVTFAAFGDFPYSNAEVQAVPRLIDDVNAANVEFSVFLGDLKGGGRCENAHYLGAIGYFDDFTAPLVYTPGDNEWTDCHMWAQDPLERLARIRQTMFATDQSFGKRTLTLEQQRPDYPENARWRIGTIEFVAVHIVGSNNNHIAEPDAEEPSTPRTAADRRAAEREYQARDAAGREWLRGTFARAITDGSAAVVIFMQADPAFDAPPEARARRYDGFDALLETLAREATAYGKPVVLVHGDSHRYRVDRPFVPNLTRVEPYGSPDVGWVQVTVDPAPAAAEPVRVVPRLVGSFPPS